MQSCRWSDGAMEVDISRGSGVVVAIVDVATALKLAFCNGVPVRKLAGQMTVRVGPNRQFGHLQAPSVITSALRLHPPS